VIVICNFLPLPIGERAGRGASGARSQWKDRFENTVQILLHCFIRETHHTHLTLHIHPIRPLLIILPSLVMRIAVDLDDELKFATVRIRDEVPP
jgi:hypothetical protein